MRLLSIDGSYLLHRGRFIVDKAEGFTHQDQLISHFMKTVLSTIEIFRPTKVYAYFDRERSPHRLQYISQYKAHRKEDPLRPLYTAAREFLYQILPYFGIISLLEDGIEADDFAHYIAQSYNQEKSTTFQSGIHVTEDRDWYLSLFPGWHMYLPRDRNMIEYGDFCELVGTTEDPRMVYLIAKAILGDKSDNIYGVPKVGWVNGLRIAKDIVFNGEVTGIDHYSQRVREHMNTVLRNSHVMNLSWVLEDAHAQQAIAKAESLVEGLERHAWLSASEITITNEQKRTFKSLDFRHGSVIDVLFSNRAPYGK